MFNINVETNVGTPTVITTVNRGMNPEEWAEAAVNRIISVSENAPMPLREQALVYKQAIKELLIDYFNKVAKSERATAQVIWDQQGIQGLMKYFDEGT